MSLSIHRILSLQAFVIAGCGDNSLFQERGVRWGKPGPSLSAEDQVPQKDETGAKGPSDTGPTDVPNDIKDAGVEEDAGEAEDVNRWETQAETGGDDAETDAFLPEEDDGPNNNARNIFKNRPPFEHLESPVDGLLGWEADRNNQFEFLAIVSDYDQDPLECSLGIYNSRNNEELLAPITQRVEPGDLFFARVPMGIGEGEIPPLSQIAWEVTCDDQFGGVTTSERFRADIGWRGVVHYWSMDEAEGGEIVVDRSGRGKEGIIGGGANRIPGAHGQGIRLDGGNDYVETDHAGPIGIENEWTFGFWLNLLGPLNFRAGGPIFVIVTDEGSPRFRPNHIEIYGDGRMKVFVKSANESHAIFGTIDRNVLGAQNVWQHYAIVKEAGNDLSSYKIYQNGSSLETELIDGAFPQVLSDNNSRKIGISKEMGLNFRYVNGIMDEVIIFNRALNEGEVRALCNRNDLEPNPCTQ